MPTYTVKLKSRQEIARETMAFHFEKPDDFYFKPGQTIDLTLIDPPESDAQGNSRVFSIASAPYERDLIIATRVRNSAFKRTLRTMAVGAEVKIEGPFGELTLHDNPDIPAVFLTGGIGITPFRSIVLQAANDKSSHHLSLFYSNRRPEEAAFLKELSGLESINRKFELVATMTQLEEDSHAWQDERGPINLPMLEAHLDHLATPVFYIAGPPRMVIAMRKLLKEAEVSSKNVRFEEFSGY